MPEVTPYFQFVTRHAMRPRAELLSTLERIHLYFPCLPDLENTDAFTTLRIRPMPAMPDDIGLQGIMPVAKDATRNALGMMVTLGRAKNNDLVVPDRRVSKFHLYFRELGGEWSVVDANSTNGSRLDGVEMVPERSYPIRSGARIELSGGIMVHVLEPEDVCRMLEDAKAWAQ
jgi:FHA domain